MLYSLCRSPFFMHTQIIIFCEFMVTENCKFLSFFKLPFCHLYCFFNFCFHFLLRVSLSASFTTISASNSSIFVEKCTIPEFSCSIFICIIIFYWRTYKICHIFPIFLIQCNSCITNFIQFRKCCIFSSLHSLIH